MEVCMSLWLSLVLELSRYAARDKFRSIWLDLTTLEVYLKIIYIFKKQND